MNKPIYKNLKIDPKAHKIIKLYTAENDLYSFSDAIYMLHKLSLCQKVELDKFGRVKE